MHFKRLAAILGLAGLAFLAACGQKDDANAPGAYRLTAEANQKYLTENALKHGVIRRPSGLQYRVISEGHGEPVKSPGDLVTVTYRGALINGRVFDQTPPGQTAQFPVGGLIQGWVEALSLMKEGDEWEIVVPAEIGYGSRAAGEIPPNQTLVFTMKLVKVEHAPGP